MTGIGEIRTAYAACSSEYAEALGTMEQTHPEDRALVCRWAADCTDQFSTPAADLATGPTFCAAEEPRSKDSTSYLSSSLMPAEVSLSAVSGWVP